MNNQVQNSYRAVALLNSLLIPIFVLALIDSLNLSFIFKLNFMLVLFIIGSLKIYCMSGIGGCILELLSGEKMVFQFRRIHQNAKDLWPGFLVVFLIIRLADLFLFVPFPSLHPYRTIYFGMMGIIATFVLAQWTIKKKYIAPLGIPLHRLKFKPSFFIVLISAFLLELVLARGVDFIHIGSFHWRNIFSYLLNYIHVFEFIFCSLFILDQYPEINEKRNCQKEIFLINPIGVGIVRGLVLLIERQYPPFFVVLKALSPKTYEFREFNRIIWQERYYKSNALVCITCFTSNCYEAYKIAKEFKKRGSKVVMGGPHVTYLPQEALMFCDSVVIGQAEGIWKDVIHDYENGTLKLQYKGPATEVDYSLVQQELLASPPAIAKDFLETMRGCKFRCHFCTIPALNGGEIHVQPINTFVEVVKKIRPQHSRLMFLDNNIYNDPGYAKELFVALKPLRIKWFSSCSIDIGKNKEILKLARESGCSTLGIGFEISTSSIEKDQGGKFSMAQKYIEYANNIKKAGIKVKGQFIFGFDSDNIKALFRLWRSCFSIFPQLTTVSLLTPLPGSGLYRQMLAEDRLISLNWRSYTCYKLVVRHPYLNPTLMSFFFPLIQSFFFLTTSSIGLLYLAAGFINLATVTIGLLHKTGHFL